MFELKKITTSIGRGLDNMVILNDQFASRHHLTIKYVGGRFELFALSIDNMASVNGYPISHIVLKNNDQIEVGFSVVPAWQGKGYASEALTEVIKYLSENEGIPCIKAWCAAENIGSKRVLEKAGMTYVNTEKNGIEVNGKTYDKLNFEYRK